MKMPPQTPRVSRQLSERAVFEGLLHEGPISRAELSKSTGLSKQTISEVVDAFEQRGWAQSVGRTSGAIGRTAVLYELRPESGFVVGVDLGETKLTAAIADMSCAIRFELTEPTDPRGGIAVLDQISRVAARLARKVDSDLAGVLCTAIGTPGVVNRNTGGIELAPNITGLDTLDVAEVIKARIGGRIVVDNDVNLALLGEIWQGCAHNSAQAAFMALGTGVGLGLAANGRLIRGAAGGAGEIGYLPLGGDPFAPETRSQGALEYEIGAGLAAVKPTRDLRRLSRDPGRLLNHPAQRRLRQPCKPCQYRSTNDLGHDHGGRNRLRSDCRRDRSLNRINGGGIRASRRIGVAELAMAGRCRGWPWVGRCDRRAQRCVGSLRQTAVLPT